MESVCVYICIYTYCVQRFLYVERVDIIAWEDTFAFEKFSNGWCRLVDEPSQKFVWSTVLILASMVAVCSWCMASARNPYVTHCCFLSFSYHERHGSSQAIKTRFAWFVKLACTLRACKLCEKPWVQRRQRKAAKREGRHPDSGVERVFGADSGGGR